MVTKNGDDQVVGEQPTRIILTIDYTTKLILPIKDGLEMIRIWCTGIELNEPYNKPITLNNVIREFHLKFISEKQLKEMYVAAMLETTPTES